MSSFLAFDLGASSGRAIVGKIADGRLELTEVHRFPNAPVEKNGDLTWDYPRLCDELVAGLGKALAFDRDIRGIGIDTWGVDYVLFGADDKKIRRLPYNYRDERTNRSSVRVWQKIPAEEIYAMTGIQKMTLNTIYQLCAHRDEHPEDLENAVFLPIPDALAFSLGGDFTAEYTHASTSNLLDPATRNWHWGLIDRLGLPRSIFPAVVEPCTQGGALKKELQEKFGCGPIPIFKVGSHDTASAVAAVPAPVSGEWAYLSAGTWALLGAEIGKPFISSASEKAGFTNEGGLDGRIRFLTNIMGSWLFQETRRVWNEAGRKLSFSDMEDMARSAEPCRFLVNPNDPEFFTPGDMPQRIRDFCRASGQGDAMTDAQVVRAVYDSLALYTAGKLAGLEKLLGVRYAAFNVVGGGTKDGFLMQLIADATGIPVIAGPVEATATGNILAQAVAAGELADLAAARETVRRSFDLVTRTPDAVSGEAFRKAAPAFAAIAGA
ncbi:MAG: rhamnulokinase [Lentisphaeria bacterium]|nr:rhamnulokinase [Lentisphaeria bacterium]